MLNVIVQSKTSITPSIAKFELVSADQQTLPAWTPGAHIELHLANGLLRQYSLCGEATASHYEIAVLKEESGRGGSAYLHDSVQVGDELTISEPKNHFPLDSADTKRLFFAAGIGVTPILAMAETTAPESFEFVMCAKSAENTPYLQRIEALSHQHLHFSAQEKNRIDIAAYLKAKETTSAIYVCGPQAFIDDVLASAKQLGWPESLLHREYFSLSSDPAEVTESGTFEVEIKSTGDVLKVSEDKSMLEVLEDNGVFLPVACEQGVCGTCVTTVLSGTPDHRDVYLTDDEKASGKLITPCCSRANSARLVLDL